MELLRFFTAGNVDDGKSTLIGRLLFDSGSISTDIIETLTKQSTITGENTSIDLALLTDGLRAEREQGITIDVAYKYFSTSKRKFIIADTPGHAQYTRNMFTGASTADLAIILIDARNGVTEQTKRHTIISSILQIPTILVCINKMDLVDYSEARFLEIKQEFLNFTSSLNLNEVSFIPTSAKAGDNVVEHSAKMSWYSGESLLSFLENVKIEPKKTNQNTRFQVQYVIRPQVEELHDYRGYAGTLINGNFTVGDAVQILPSGLKSQISKIEYNLSEVDKASEGQPIVIQLEDDIDISRGMWLVPEKDTVKTSNDLVATICWMDNHSFQQGTKFLLQQGSARTKAVIKDIHHSIDIETYENRVSDGQLKLNELAQVSIRTAEPIIVDSFTENKSSGSFILINEYTNQTVAVGFLKNSI